MRIVVIGCGKIGVTILNSLVKEGHDVVIVEKNPEKIEEITNIYDVIGVCGNGADCDTLQEASISDADLVIATTDSDEINMLSCFLAKRMGSGNTVARIRNPEYNDNSLNFMRKELGISMAINPELLAAYEIFNILKLPSAAKIETFSVRNFELIELNLRNDSPFDGVRIIDMRSKYDAKFLICAVKRGENAYIPDGNFILRSGDKIALTAKPSEITKLLREMGHLRKQARNVMILGGSRTAYYLAKMLSQSGSTITIIERNKTICQELAEAMPKAVIINGDGAKQELLLEEGLQTVDAFLSLTGIDEENILLSAFAESQNVPKVITKVNREELIPLSEHWGLDCIISPKKLIADKLVQYARALENSVGSSVETVYKLMDDMIEVSEFRVKSDFPKLNIPFKELKTKENALIAGIVRDRKIIIPSGDDYLVAGDKVVITSNRRINKLSDILG